MIELEIHRQLYIQQVNGMPEYLNYWSTIGSAVVIQLCDFRNNPIIPVQILNACPYQFDIAWSYEDRAEVISNVLISPISRTASS